MSIFLKLYDWGILGIIFIGIGILLFSRYKNVRHGQEAFTDVLVVYTTYDYGKLVAGICFIILGIYFGLLRGGLIN